MATLRVPKITPRWLKLKDAALYSAIGEKRLIAMAEEGEITGFQDPDNGRSYWIFDRESIDRYREGQVAQNDPGRSERVAMELFVAHEKRRAKREAQKRLTIKCGKGLSRHK